jgi:hypothetical protein
MLLLILYHSLREDSRSRLWKRLEVVALRKSGLLADLLEATWDAANFYPEAFSTELVAWKAITDLASEVSIHFQAGRLVGLWY